MSWLFIVGNNIFKIEYYEDEIIFDDKIYDFLWVAVSHN